MKELIDLDFFTRIFYPSHLKEKDGVMYCIGKRTDMDKNAYVSDLYRVVDGKAEALTASHDVQDYTLLDDGIAFASAREQKDKDAIKGGEPLTVFQKLPYGGGEAQEFLRLPYFVSQIEWLPKGRLLFRATYDHTLQSFLMEYEGNMEKALKDKREQDEALTVVDELPFWFNGAGFVNKKRTALFYHDGEDVRMLTDPYAEIGHVRLNQDKTQALYTRVIYQDVKPLEDELRLLDIESGHIITVPGVQPGAVDDYAFGPDDTVLYVLSNESDPHGLVAGNPRLYSVGLKDGKSRLLDNSGGMYNYYNSVGSDVKLGTAYEGIQVRGRDVYFLCTLLNDSHIVRCNVDTGEFAQVTKEPGMVQECIFYEDGIAVLAMRGNGIGDIYTVNLDGEERKITDFNGTLMETYEVVTPIEMSYTNREGTEIYGWVMPPVDYVPGMVYPTILNIHGGPKTVYGSVFFHEMQYWCAQGYAVIFCNPTGGDGRGEEFADIRGKYGTVDYDDIMGFVDEAVTRFGFVSSMRMGVTGGSYGGFMTNWIIGHTDRFSAAASQRSISNWIGFYNTSDIGYYFGRDQMQATPWKDHKDMWRASPLKYADKVSTPTLFIHSEEDYRCSMFEGIQMYYALRHFGVDTRLCLFKGENHELSRSGKPKNRIRRLQEITRWMDKYVKIP